MVVFCFSLVFTVVLVVLHSFCWLLQWLQAPEPEATVEIQKTMHVQVSQT